jgi:hypothetical protein
VSKVPTIKVEARCRCEPFQFVLFYVANRMATLGCAECGEVAVHIDIEWPPQAKE